MLAYRGNTMPVVGSGAVQLNPQISPAPTVPIEVYSPQQSRMGKASPRVGIVVIPQPIHCLVVLVRRLAGLQYRHHSNVLSSLTQTMPTVSIRPLERYY